MARSEARQSGEPMIEVDHLSRYYGPSPALEDISFTAYRGEILGFLGPNGAGKTTTMRILTGYMPPSDGTARVAGHDVVSESMEARRHIGYLPESTPLYPEMTIYRYLDFMGRLRDVQDRGKAIERVMKQVSISDRADQLIGQLSKGLRQRVGIAQALLHGPDVIILDEPTIGLDPRQIREVRQLISNLRGDHTVILSTHILPEAQQVCDRVLIINRGRIVAEDTPDRLTARLSGGERVRVAVANGAPVEEVRMTLAGLAGVGEVEATGGGGFVVTAKQDAVIRPALARMIVEKGWELSELTPIGLSLEEVFLELTGDAQAAAELAGVGTEGETIDTERDIEAGVQPDDDQPDDNQPEDNQSDDVAADVEEADNA